MNNCNTEDNIGVTGVSMLVESPCTRLCYNIIIMYTYTNVSRCAAAHNDLL